MESAFRDVPIPMHHLVAVRSEPPGQFTAWVPSFPEVRVVAATEQEAIDQVTQALAEWFATTRLVEVKVLTPPVVNPILKWAGHVDPNDEVEQMYLEELARMKKEDLERTLREYDEECPNSSSTPTT